MILVDTGPLVALFDPADGDHRPCSERLRTLGEPLSTTVPVLTEAFDLLGPANPGTHALMNLVASGALNVWSFDDAGLSRAFELMHRYSDLPMDFADASLVIAAETLGVRKVFTLDRKDFNVYRVRSGHRHLTFEIV